MPRTYVSPQRRRSKLPTILLILVVLIVAGIVWLSTLDTEVPTKKVEQDVTNAALAQ